MSMPEQLTSVITQAYGAKQSIVKPKSPILLRESKALSDISDQIAVTACVSPFVQLSNIPLTGMAVGIKLTVERKTVLKESVLALIHMDKSIPTHLRIKKGSIRELDEGVFAKRRRNGVLEIYVSEE